MKEFYRSLDLWKEEFPDPQSPILLLATHQDLPDALPLQAIAGAFQLDRSCVSGRPWRLQGLSGLRCDRFSRLRIRYPDVLLESFDWLVQGAPTVRTEFVRCYYLYRKGRAELGDDDAPSVLVRAYRELPNDVVLHVASYLPQCFISS